MERKISKKEARKQGVWGNNLACGGLFSEVRRCGGAEVRGQFASRFFKGRVYSRTFVPSYIRTPVYQSGRR